MYNERNESDEKPKIYYEIVSKKNELESYLKKVERSIYDYETKYLESWQYTGNIFKGWEHIFTNKSKIPTVSTLPLIKRNKLPSCERMFSITSFNNPLNREETNVQNGTTNLRHPSFHSNHTNNMESHRDIIKKKKKKIYSSLSFKKKKIVLNGNGNKNNFLP
jgi:hypothetical protein